MLKAIHSFITRYRRVQVSPKREMAKLLHAYEHEIHADRSEEPLRTASIKPRLTVNGDQEPFIYFSRKQEIINEANRTARNHPRCLSYKALALACGLTELEIAEYFDQSLENVNAWCRGWATVPSSVKLELENLLSRKSAEVRAARLIKTTDILILTIPSVAVYPLGLYLSTAGSIISLKKADVTKVVYASDLSETLKSGVLYGDHIIHELYAK